MEGSSCPAASTIVGVTNRTSSSSNLIFMDGTSFVLDVGQSGSMCVQAFAGLYCSRVAGIRSNNFPEYVRRLFLFFQGRQRITEFQEGIRSLGAIRVVLHDPQKSLLCLGKIRERIVTLAYPVGGIGSVVALGTAAEKGFKRFDCRRKIVGAVKTERFEIFRGGAVLPGRFGRQRLVDNRNFRGLRLPGK